MEHEKNDGTTDTQIPDNIEKSTRLGIEPGASRACKLHDHGSRQIYFVDGQFLYINNFYFILVLQTRLDRN